MATLLASRVTVEVPTATSDLTQVLLISDPTIPQFSSNQPSPIIIPALNLTESAISNSASDAEVIVKNDTASEHWINSRWRPAMGWLYLTTCAFDFIIFPILWSILQAVTKGSVTVQWQPVTLQGAGLYHIAMGAVLGIAAYGRTKEKIAEKA